MEENCEDCMRWEEQLYWTHFQTVHFSQLLLPGFHNRLAIPKKFSTYCKRKLPKIVTLKSPSGTKYNVGLEEDDEKSLAFRCGWDTFVKDHSLHESDLLVFKFNGSSEFEVLIFDGDTLCEKPTSYFVRKCGHAAEKISSARDFTATSSRSPKRYINNSDVVETTVNQQKPVGNELDDLIDIDIDTMLNQELVVPQTGFEQEEHVNSDIDTDSGQLLTSKGPISEGKYPIGVFKKMRGQISINDLDSKADVEMISSGSGSRKRVGETNKKKALSLAKRAISPKGFLVVMKRTHVVSKCYLNIPVQWSTRYMSPESQDVVMQVDQTKWHFNLVIMDLVVVVGFQRGGRSLQKTTTCVRGMSVCLSQPRSPRLNRFI